MMHTFCQTLINQCSASGASFGRVAWVNKAHDSASVFSFVERELHKLIPSRIVDGFTQTVIPDHALDVQILKCDYSKRRNERVAQCVREVTAATGDSFVNAPRRLPLLFSLGTGQRLLGCAKETGVRNLLARRKRGEVAKP